MTAWVLSGDVENLKMAIKESVWGVTEKLRSEWEALNKDDDLVFYCSRPVSGIVGFAKAKNKFKQDQPLWREEREKKSVIWPYRFDFEVLYALPENEWQRRAIRLKRGLRIMRGMSRIKNPDLLNQIYDEAKERWGYGPKTDSDKSEHSHIKELLVELGRLTGYIAEQEFVFPDIKERLDVVWRRVVASVPTFAFEVHIEGNMHQALTKLKHAYDIWNSNIYLVVKDEELGKASQYVEGAFHEIKSRLRIITVSKVRELYDIQKKDFQLKSEVGFR